MHRIVIDTNVLIDGVQDEDSATHKIIKSCVDGKITAIISYRIKKENEKMINKLLNDSEYFSLMDEFFNACEEVSPEKRINAVDADRDDNKFVEAGVAADADYIVTSDSHLLDLDEYEGIRIITPEQMWNVYRDDSDEDSQWNVWTDALQE
ncbi:MAG: putative toxin-antitoxin system toxin component, PIN family [Patescibacteria group bacterium]|jgi:putative PIN family toxin of toxin-antitoxin system